MIVGIICGGYIGRLQIRWFRLAEANGTQYFRVIAWAFYETITSSFFLTSVNSIGRDRGEIGTLNPKAAREEQGQWIIPGYAPITTSRGKRALETEQPV